MKPLLSDYIFSDHLRYEAHQLIYTPESGEPIVLGGILGAALLCVRLLNTDEQKERGFFLSEELHYEPFFVQYDSEVIADDWGYIEAELEQLDSAYIALLSNEEVFLETFCPNKRQLSIALDVVATYMRRITTERYGEHIYELVPWTTPFAQWLFNAAYVEPQRQRFLLMDWNDPAQVHELACSMEETDYDFIKPEMKDFTPDQINLFRKWMNQWTTFVNRKIKPEKEITFWTKDVTEELQETLLDYIKSQERQPQRYKCLAVAVYVLRHLGYVTYNIAPSSIAKWLSERLQDDYSTKNGTYQFTCAWNELSRYPAVKDEVAYLDHVAK